MELPNKRNQLFYLIKLMRLSKGFAILDVPNLMVKIKNIYKEKSIKMIAKDPIKAEDISADHNNIVDQLLIGYAIKIAKLIIVILNFSYLLGCFWYIMIKLVEDYGGYDYSILKDQELNQDTFIVNYKL